MRVGVDVLDGAGRLEPPVDGDYAELVDMAGVQALHHHRVLVQLLLRHHPLRLLLLPKISFYIRKKREIFVLRQYKTKGHKEIIYIFFMTENLKTNIK